MAATYEIVMRDPFGNFVASASQHDFLTLDYTLKVNAVGGLTIDLPASRYPMSMFDEDYRLEIWRKPRKGVNYLEGETCWFLQHLEGTRSKTTIQAETANTLLNRRVVAYQDDVNEAKVLKIQPGDNMLKNAVRENTGVGAPSITTGSYNHAPPDTIRYLAPYLTVEDNRGAWITYRRRISHDPLIGVATTNSEKAVNRGTVFFFYDIVQIDNTGTANPFLELRTYEGQRGTDRRGFVIVSEEDRTLVDAKLIYDWKDSATRVYVGGPGTGVDRLFSTADAPDLATILARNPFGLREKFFDSRKAKDQDETDSEANSKIVKQGLNPFKQLEGTLTEAMCNRYGDTFFFGDHITASFLGQNFDTFVSPVHVLVDGGKEKFDVKITEKAGVYTTGITQMIKETNQLKARLTELETIDIF